MPKSWNPKTSLSSATRRSPPVSCHQTIWLNSTRALTHELSPLSGRNSRLQHNRLAPQQFQPLESTLLWWCHRKHPPQFLTWGSHKTPGFSSIWRTNADFLIATNSLPQVQRKIFWLNFNQKKIFWLLRDQHQPKLHRLQVCHTGIKNLDLSSLAEPCRLTFFGGSAHPTSGSRW